MSLDATSRELQKSSYDRKLNSMAMNMANSMHISFTAIRAPRLFSSARPLFSEFDHTKSSRTKMDSTSVFYVKIRA